MNIKKIIIILLILLAIIAIALVAVVVYEKYQENYSYDPPQEDEVIEIDKSLKQVEIRNNFYAVKTCVEKFYIYLEEVDTSGYTIIDEAVEESLELEETIKREAIYSMLDDNYIESNGITEDNVFENIQQIGASDVYIDNMYVSQQNENMYIYLVYGRLRNQTTRENTDFTLMLKVDMTNRTFEVIPAEYISEYIREAVIGQEISIDIGTEIEANDYNIFSYEIISVETYITDMFNDFKTNMMYDYETAYEKLNEEYREAKFATYEEFENYAVENIRNSVIMQLSQYQVNTYDDYTQYVCVDQNGNYYIFNETAVMDYTVILDTYTIDLPQFIEQYNSSEDSEKVLLNIEKVFEAINDGDYSYVYDKLDDTFKETNFPTLEAFETYMTENLYENNTIGYSSYQTNGDLHIYEISITNADDESSGTITKNFIMQLLDGTDFVMSFSV